MVSKRVESSFRAVPRDSMREWLEEVLGGLPEFSIRRLFGGAGIYSGLLATSARLRRPEERAQEEAESSPLRRAFVEYL